ncbi:hypothetical protein PIB30_018789 [Stylosanthes scabra]|uniref:GRF-type domain-containing protein n=1 Tax=Stylosanthes scabra TaxID=79078 RepID=A0ABU6R895_9FABA|nr:hypothetical protein [Stylosanthes scabra]
MRIFFPFSNSSPSPRHSFLRRYSFLPSPLIPLIATPSSVAEVGITTYQDMSHRGKKYTQESAGSGSFSSSGDRICYCGLQTPIQVSKSEANPGREYYSCPTGRRRWFMWAEPAGNCSGQLGAQIRERDAEENQVGFGSIVLC